MNFEEMSKEELIEYIKNINETNNGKYGLLWDKEKEPEKIIEECNKNIPILKEIENKKIENEDSAIQYMNLAIKFWNLRKNSIDNYLKSN